MKREHSIWYAGALGLAAIVGFLAVRKFLAKNEYNSYYADYHKLFDLNQPEQQHGIEYL